MPRPIVTPRIPASVILACALACGLAGGCDSDTPIVESLTRVTDDGARDVVFLACGGGAARENVTDPDYELVVEHDGSHGWRGHYRVTVPGPRGRARTTVLDERIDGDELADGDPVVWSFRVHDQRFELEVREDVDGAFECGPPQ